MWYAILTGDAYVHAMVPVVCTELLEVCVAHLRHQTTLGLLLSQRHHDALSITS